MKTYSSIKFYFFFWAVCDIFYSVWAELSFIFCCLKWFSLLWSWTKHEADHWPPCRSKVNAWIFLHTFYIQLHSVLHRQRDSFTIYVSYQQIINVVLAAGLYLQWISRFCNIEQIWKLLIVQTGVLFLLTHSMVDELLWTVA
jgi:hypothetical protein